MWAITSYFNPARYKRRLSNYRIFRANLCIPLVAVELSFDGAFELTENDADILIQISGGAVLWQKERLLNIALKSVPSSVSIIVWLDCDVVFDRLDWVAQAKAQLHTNELVQLYSDVVDLNRDEVPGSEHSEIVPYAHGIVSLVDRGEITAFTTLQDHPTRRPVQKGLAWAANRKILDTHGFYDALILGSGDRSIAFAMYGRLEDLVRSLYMNEMQRKHYLRWAIRFNESVSGRIGYVPGRLYHLWHGEIQNRLYDQRYKMFSNFVFDPENDIEIGLNGAWQWARPRPELASFLAQYFVSRDEDGDGK